jgi:DNA-binding beta-propeller fold protein YncE
MREGRTVEPGGFFRRPLGVCAWLVALSVVGCNGDTLYDPVAPDVDPPVIQILVPSSGAQVQSGQRVPIRVSGTDQEGVSSITIRVTGVVQQNIFLQFVPPRTTVQADTAVTVPPGLSGNIQVVASGVNTKGVGGESQAVSLSVTDVDILPPWVSLTVSTAARMELTDSIRVTVRAYDNPGGSGVARTTLTAIVSNTARTDTLVLSPSQNFGGAASDTAVGRFAFAPPFVDPLNLPDTLHILFFGLAYDRQGNCGGAVTPAFTNQVACDTVVVAGAPRIIASAVTEARQTIAVSGRTSPTPGGGILADILVDTLQYRVYASNLSRNRIQILQAATGAWDQREVWVGAEPWGMAMNRNGDSLFVANSGGTSISFVSLVGAPKEDQDRRFVTQNNALWEVSEEEGKLVASFYDFSDRPQFVAQDAAGRILYSTKPTSAATTGTARVAWREPGWSSIENRILVFADDLTPSSKTTAIAHVDSVYAAVTGDCVQIWDHKPGFPEIVVTSGCLPLDSALAVMDQHKAAGDSDIWYVRGSAWQFERLALRDTTFVAASGNREWIAFGEGGTGAEEAGRITLWSSSRSAIHSRLLVADLVNNASERVTGLDLNQDGSLGSASGEAASYYWSTDLRLQGSVTKSPPGGAGAVLHPRHPAFTPASRTDSTTVSFVGQADHTVRILDTAHFTERGQLHIRDNIVGTLRAGPPLPTDNGGTGAACVGQDCVVVKLYAVTDGGGVVVVDVRRRDMPSLP